MKFSSPEVTATGLGEWPGSDPVEAAKVSLGLLTPPHLPFVPELSARGVGSDPVGRTASLLADLAVDVQPYGWRFVDRPGQDLRRATSALSTDINVLADVAGGAGRELAELKVSVLGPLSLAANIHLHYGERSLVDSGARRDVAQSLGAGLAALAQRLRGAAPTAELTLQVDEPNIAAIVAGSIPTVSGYRTLRAVAVSEVRQTWSDFIGAARDAGFVGVALNMGQVLAVAGGDPGSTLATESWTSALELALAGESDAVALSLSGLGSGHWEKLAEAVESGKGIWLGVVPVGGELPAYGDLVERVLRPWRGIGLSADALNAVRLTPQQGLARLTPAQATAVMKRAVEVAAALTDARES